MFSWKLLCSLLNHNLTIQCCACHPKWAAPALGFPFFCCKWLVYEIDFFANKFWGSKSWIEWNCLLPHMIAMIIRTLHIGKGCNSQRLNKLIIVPLPSDFIGGVIMIMGDLTVPMKRLLMFEIWKILSPKVQCTMMCLLLICSPDSGWYEKIMTN